MFGIPIQILTGTKEYREALNDQPESPTAKRDVTLAVLCGVYLPVVVGIAWAWLHNYSPIQYWLSVAVVQAAGLALLLVLVLARSVARIRRRG